MGYEPQWPTTTRGLRQMLRNGLDWMDVLLFIGMIALLYALLGKVFDHFGGTRFIALAAFAPVIARRMIFGAPDRGVRRMGALWSVIGMVGLVALLLGAGTTSVGIWDLAEVAARTEPDWAAEIRADAASGKMITVTSVIPGESPEESARRQRAALEAQTAELLATQVPKEHEDWLKDRARSRSAAWAVVGGGLALVALGALLDRVRFHRGAVAAAQGA